MEDEPNVNDFLSSIDAERVSKRRRFNDVLTPSQKKKASQLTALEKLRQERAERVAASMRVKDEFAVKPERVYEEVIAPLTYKEMRAQWQREDEEKRNSRPRVVRLSTKHIDVIDSDDDYETEEYDDDMADFVKEDKKENWHKKMMRAGRKILDDYQYMIYSECLAYAKAVHARVMNDLELAERRALRETNNDNFDVILSSDDQSYTLSDIEEIEEDEKQETRVKIKSEPKTVDDFFKNVKVEYDDEKPKIKKEKGKVFETEFEKQLWEAKEEKKKIKKEKERSLWEELEEKATARKQSRLSFQETIDNMANLIARLIMPTFSTNGEVTYRLIQYSQNSPMIEWVNNEWDAFNDYYRLIIGVIVTLLMNGEMSYRKVAETLSTTLIKGRDAINIYQPDAFAYNKMIEDLDNHIKNDLVSTNIVYEEDEEDEEDEDGEDDEGGIISIENVVKPINNLKEDAFRPVVQSKGTSSVKPYMGRLAIEPSSGSSSAGVTKENIIELTDSDEDDFGEFSDDDEGGAQHTKDDDFHARTQKFLKEYEAEKSDDDIAAEIDAPVKPSLKRKAPVRQLEYDSENDMWF